MADEILLANPNTSENKSRRSSVFAVDSDGTWETKKKTGKKEGTENFAHFIAKFHSNLQGCNICRTEILLVPLILKHITRAA
jgi:hypothetical protein